MKDKSPTPRTNFQYDKLPGHFLDAHDSSNGFLSKMVVQASPHELAVMSILTRLVPFAFPKPGTSRATLSMRDLSFEDGGVSLDDFPDLVDTVKLLRGVATAAEFVRDAQMPGIVIVKLTWAIDKDKLFVIADPTYRAISPDIPPIC